MKAAETLKDSLLRATEFSVNDKKYWLIPFSKSDAQHSTRIELLADWRRDHQYAYPSRFEITISGTQKWLEHVVINNQDRILFWVTDSNMHPLGHLGLLKNSAGLIEIDNVLKGASGHKGLFSIAMSQLEKLVIQELGRLEIELKVLRENHHAVNFYKTLGYEVKAEIGMEWHETNDSKVLKVSTNPTDYLLKMQKSLFFNDDVPEMILTAGPSISHLESVLVNDAVTTGWNSKHSNYIKDFELEFAEGLGVKYALSTSSCTGALHLALLALGIGKGDEVIVPDITWVATASAVAYTGATPIFADVDNETWNISPKTLAPLITSKTKAIIPVHLYGFAAPMDALKIFADNHGLKIVEDAAPAIGTQIGSKFAGTFGDFGCFSFQGAKLLVTGEGGMLVTDNLELYEKAWKIQDHGRKPGTFWIEELGHKYKMNNITAALGLAQFNRASVQIERKREINALYRHLLGGAGGLEFQEEIPETKSICWMSSIRLNESFKSNVLDLSHYLRENGVDTRPVFPTIHSYPMWETSIENPNSRSISQNSLNLPSGVLLSEKSISKVSNLILKWIDGNG